MRGITKRFLDTTANDHVDFVLYPGEICALLGENGAGKTTLMNILFGYYSFDEGEILIDGKPAVFASPRDAIALGIGMIHQHFTLVPTLTVLENIIIGVSDSANPFLNLRAARERLLELQDRFGLHVDPDALVWTLSVGQQQKVEILKALYRNSKILIMDEPTAVLAPSETPELFRTLRMLADEGRAIIFISHKLYEVMDISNRVMVLRNGKVEGGRETRNTSTRELANMMVGREVLERIEQVETEPGDVVLRIDGLTALSNKGLEAVRSLSMNVREREIVGVAGVSGNGQSELCDVLFGMRSPTSGTVTLSGKPMRLGVPGEAVKRGIARIPEDRIETGLMMDLSVEENLILENHASPEYGGRGLVRKAAIAEHVEELINTYSIKTDGRTAAAKSLSGGNLQKIILARELSSDPKLVVASQPTRGLDIGAMEYIHGRIIEEKKRGAGVLLVSDDLDEVMNLSDRIIVLYEGRIMGEVRGADADREQIGLWMSGVQQ